MVREPVHAVIAPFAFYLGGEALHERATGSGQGAKAIGASHAEAVNPQVGGVFHHVFLFRMCVRTWRIHTIDSRGGRGGNWAVGAAVVILGWGRSEVGKKENFPTPQAGAPFLLSWVYRGAYGHGPGAWCCLTRGAAWDRSRERPGS